MKDSQHEYTTPILLPPGIIHKGELGLKLQEVQIIHFFSNLLELQAFYFLPFQPERKVDIWIVQYCWMQGRLS